MPKKPQRKLTSAQRRAKRERRRKYMTIFVNGRQKRVPRPQMFDGLSVDEFIRSNADLIWLHQNEMWGLMEPVKMYDRWFENLPPEGLEI